MLAGGAVACGGDSVQCGPGTSESGGRCVAPVVKCGDGTVLQNGVCVSPCAQGEYWNGLACRPIPGCAGGTALDGGSCIPSCAEKTYWDGKACVPIPTCEKGTTFDGDAGACVPAAELCAQGTHLDADAGVCVPDATDCGPGTHKEDAACVPDAVPAPDVSESTDPQGTATFDLPAAGSSLSLGGAINTPTDLNGDGMVDADYDAFAFQAKANTWLRLHATSQGAAHPALVIISDAEDSQGAPLYSRYAIEPLALDSTREVYLPRDGKYIIIVSDYDHIVADLYGWSMIPVGGDDYIYRVDVENLGTPTPKSLTGAAATETGDVKSGALHFFQLDGLAVNDAREVIHEGVPAGHAYSDVFKGLMLFGPDGAVLRDTVSYATNEDASVRFAATAAGNHLVVLDHLMTIGDRLDYELNMSTLVPTDCGTTDCATGTLAAGEKRLLRWDLNAGELFVAGVSLPSGATTTLNVDLLDEGMAQLGATSSASQYGPAKAMHYAAKNQPVYLVISEDKGAAVASYTLDDRVNVTPLLTAGTPNTGMTVTQMPAGTYDAAGYAHFVGIAGKVVVSVGLTVSGPNWTAPVEEYLSPNLALLGPALDVTAANFTDLSPLMAWVPAAGHCLHRVRNAAAGDITAETYDTALYALDPADLGTPAIGTPKSLIDKTLEASTGLGIFKFVGTVGPKANVKVTPKAGAVIQPDVWVATPGASSTTGGTNTWKPDAADYRLGVAAKGKATAAGTAVTVQATPSYAGVHLVIVRDASGSAPLTDKYDIEVSLSN